MNVLFLNISETAYGFKATLIPDNTPSSGVGFNITTCDGPTSLTTDPNGVAVEKTTCQASSITLPTRLQRASDSADFGWFVWLGANL